MSARAVLNRTTFTTSRLLEFCSRKELVAQTGHEPDDWPLVIIKELVDNSLDSCEEASVAPVIHVTVARGMIRVRDNGPGIPPDTIASILDFTTRTSSREKNLIETGWPEQFDCAIATTGGYTTRAVKDLFDLLATSSEPVTVFCIHDADAAGTMIYHTLQNETKARGARKVEIVNLGLEPWEGVSMGCKSRQSRGPTGAARSRPTWSSMMPSGETGSQPTAAIPGATGSRATGSSSTRCRRPTGSPGSPGRSSSTRRARSFRHLAIPCRSSVRRRRPSSGRS
jgi:hypothetical protein